MWFHISICLYDSVWRFLIRFIPICHYPLGAPPWAQNSEIDGICKHAERILESGAPILGPASLFSTGFVKKKRLFSLIPQIMLAARNICCSQKLSSSKLVLGRNALHL